ncbi:MAG: hypothetical protein HQ564_01405 [Candidatus Saganbacteria bacterium]|nr:hypothetical protein [Candidatus Saganbacteria bacterium]
MTVIKEQILTCINKSCTSISWTGAVDKLFQQKCKRPPTVKENAAYKKRLLSVPQNSGKATPAEADVRWWPYARQKLTKHIKLLGPDPECKVSKKTPTPPPPKPVKKTDSRPPDAGVGSAPDSTVARLKPDLSKPNLKRPDLQTPDSKTAPKVNQKALSNTLSRLITKRSKELTKWKGKLHEFNVKSQDNKINTVIETSKKAVTIKGKRIALRNLKVVLKHAKTAYEVAYQKEMGGIKK